MSVYQLFYVSRCSEAITDSDVDNILKVSRENNSKKNITGILLFRSGLFLQLLEGEKDLVQALFAKVEKDPRHRHVIKVLEKSGNDRIFGEWSMGYRKVEELELKMINEVLSWQKLITASKDLDNHLILHMLSRFHPNAKSKSA